MHCKFSKLKGILRYIPSFESHVLRHGQLQQEDLNTNWMTGLKCTLHPVQSIIEVYMFYGDP